MANLHQLNISYDPGEDRLLLKMTTRGGEQVDEYRVWLTRRLVLLLWQALEKTVTATVAADPAVTENHQQSVVKFQEETALQQADFATPYSTPVNIGTPLGETPLLASKIRLQRQPDNNLALSLQHKDGLGINLVLNATMLHGLRKLLVDGVKMAQWGLELRNAGTSVAGQAAGTKKSLVN